MATSVPLVVAIVASVLLVATIAVDATVNRVIRVEVQDDGEWVGVYEEGAPQRDPYAYAKPLGPFGKGVRVDPNGTISLRLVIENAYPWGYDKTYRVVVEGSVVHEGRVSAPASGDATSEFSLDARRFFSGPGATRDPSLNATTAYVYFEVRLGAKSIYVSFPATEASA